MASANRTPKVSRISRGQTLAYARKQQPMDAGESAGPDEDAAEASASASQAPSAPSAKPAPRGEPPGLPLPAASPESAPTASTEPAPAAPAKPAPRGEPPEPAHAQMNTVAMPPLTALGAPPAIPAPGPAVPVQPDAAAAERPTRMPGPREIPDGHPEDPAPPPGSVPRGDSRSMRRRTDRHEFALIYRMQTYVISRVGEIGKRGQWRVVEYPTPSMAAHAYAKECSRFVSEGFSDYRE